MLENFVNIIDELLNLLYPVLNYLLHITAPLKSSEVTCNSWKYANTNELKKYDEDFLTCELTMNISVSDCGGCGCDEVEGVDVYHRHVILLMNKQRPLLPALFIHPSYEDPNTWQSVEKYQQNEACFEHHMAIANRNCIVNVSLLKFSDHKV